MCVLWLVCACVGFRMFCCECVERSRVSSGEVGAAPRGRMGFAATRPSVLSVFTHVTAAYSCAAVRVQFGFVCISNFHGLVSVRHLRRRLVHPHGLHSESPVAHRSQCVIRRRRASHQFGLNPFLVASRTESFNGSSNLVR
ncbi:tubby like protein 2 [Striga asiatica]|uniref:Tubby like protein 2 n=1 Tax=Striga asiatica TaxID=4170 RepID=A0A5A7PXD6_STRAF|nr:tubby like protein 2 [Striga asiatica]